MVGPELRHNKQKKWEYRESSEPRAKYISCGSSWANFTGRQGPLWTTELKPMEQDSRGFHCKSSRMVFSWSGDSRAMTGDKVGVGVTSGNDTAGAGRTSGNDE